MTVRISSEAIASARTVSIANELARRSITLRREGQELVGACPRCGDGGKGIRSDRFAVHLVKQIWRCRRCPAGGDVIDLVRHLDGVDFHEAVARLTGEAAAPTSVKMIEVAPVAPPPTPIDDGYHAAMVIWHAAGPIAGTLAERYLIEARELTLPPDLSPRVLRFHPRCPYGKGERHPCLVALYRDIRTDAPRAIMRTALAPEGAKISRMARGPVGSAAIKLTAGDDVTMGLAIGEGLETTLAGMMQGFVPAWALGSDGGIRTFPVLAGIEALTIFEERENADAVQECMARWLADDREVSTLTSMTGSDMNDAVI
jgi:hypothetical protein